MSQSDRLKNWLEQLFIANTTSTDVCFPFRDFEELEVSERERLELFEQ